MVDDQTPNLLKANPSAKRWPRSAIVLAIAGGILLIIAITVATIFFMFIMGYDHHHPDL